VACGRSGDKGLIPDLIALLQEEEPLLASAADKGLQALTGRRFNDPTRWRNRWEGQTQK
jgi:hypothetical protein